MHTTHCGRRSRGTHVRSLTTSCISRAEEVLQAQMYYARMQRRTHTGTEAQQHNTYEQMQPHPTYRHRHIHRHIQMQTQIPTDTRARTQQLHEKHIHIRIHTQKHIRALLAPFPIPFAFTEQICTFTDTYSYSHACTFASTYIPFHEHVHVQIHIRVHIQAHSARVALTTTLPILIDIHAQTHDRHIRIQMHRDFQRHMHLRTRKPLHYAHMYMHVYTCILALPASRRNVLLPSAFSHQAHP